MMYPSLKSRYHKGTLIDRGANGGVAGEDVRVISKSDRTVNISGIDNHEMKNVPVGTVGGVALSQYGDVIAIMHQYAIAGKGRTVHSSTQLEHCKNEVFDRSQRAQGGLQCIRTLDGYVHPIDILNGLAHTPMRPFTDDEWDRLPHVIWTSDQPWDPSIMDCAISDEPDWHKDIDEITGGKMGHKFNVRGEYTRRRYEPGMEYDRSKVDALDFITLLISTHRIRTLVQKPLCRKTCHYLWMMRKNIFNEDNDLIDSSLLLTIAKSERKLSQGKYNQLKPCFLFSSKDVVEKTLDATAQFGKTILAGPNLRNTIKSPFPANNVLRCNEPVAADTIYASTPAIDSGGITMGQFYIGRLSHVADIFGILTEKQFVNTLEDIIRKRGAMDLLISDSARVEISNRVHDVLRGYGCDDWQSEGYFQHQNFAERGYRDIKIKTIIIMNATGANDNEWLLIMKYVIYIHNRLAFKSLGWKTPLEKLTGQTPDISIIYQMPYRTIVYYSTYEKQFPNTTSSEGIGYFVGFAENVGHNNTFLVLTHDTNKVIARSRIRPAENPPNKRLMKIVQSEDHYEMMDQETGETVDTIINPFVDDDTKLDYINYEDIQDDKPKVKPMSTIPIDDLEGRSFLLPSEIDGTRHRAKIIKVYGEHKKMLANEPDLIKLRIKVNDEEYDELVAYNELNEFIEQNLLHDDDVWTYRKILAHEGPFNEGDDRYQGSKHNVLIKWETGECTWEPTDLLDMDDHKVDLALYARDNNLLDLPGWKKYRRLAKRHKKMKRMANQAKMRSIKNSPKYMFGVRVPNNHEEAMKLDELNGNNYWDEAEKKEVGEMDDIGVFRSLGLKAKVPSNYKLIKVHMVYAVKHDGRHKARLVANGNLTSALIDSNYSGVVSLRSIRLVCFIAELNGLELWGADISYAYLMSYTDEKVCIIAGPEFGPLEGHLLIIVRALYGLRMSGVCWHKRFAQVLEDMGFFPCRMDPDVWMRHCGDHYEYVATYVDDLAVVSKDPARIIINYAYYI